MCIRDRYISQEVLNTGCPPTMETMETMEKCAQLWKLWKIVCFSEKTMETMETMEKQNLSNYGNYGKIEFEQPKKNHPHVITKLQCCNSIFTHLM